MQIKSLNLDPQFEEALDELVDKYDENMLYLNGFHEDQLNFSEFIDNFVDQNVAEVTIDANANANGNKDIRSLISEKGKSIDKLFAFNKIFFELNKEYGLETAKNWLEAEYSGKFYLHDAPSSTMMPYCYAYDLTRLAEEGLFFLKDYNNEPPKHLTTFLDDVIEFVSFFCNRSSGAVGLPDLLYWVYYFWKEDINNEYYLKDPNYYLKQNLQKLIYRLNQPFLRVDQSSFSNVSVYDHEYLSNLFGGRVFPNGELAIDHIEGIMEVQKVFMDVVYDIRNTNLFTYPVLSTSLLYKDGKFVDEPFAKWSSKHNMKWNDRNFFISDQVTALSNCCRLLSDTSKLDAFVNSIGGTALSIGSLKVSTINLMRLAIEAGKDKDKYLELLKEAVTLDCQALDRVRHIIQRNIEKGLLPNYVDGGVEIDKQYNTVGILGTFEVIEYFGFIKKDEFGNHFYTDEGLEFAGEILNVINTTKDAFAEDKNYSINLESVPAERCAVILAQKDTNIYGGEEIGNKEIYSNQFIPLTAQCTIQEKLRVDGILCHKCGGGVISHINIESEFPNEEMAWEMLNRIAENNVIYSAFCTKINECENHHGFVGSDICPTCGEGVYDTYQRVVGFLTPSRNYSKERKEEFSKRKWWKISQMNEM